MSHSVVGRYVGLFCYRQCASRGDNPVPCDDKGSVVERGVLEEQVHYQASVYSRIDTVSCAYDFLKGSVVGNHDECSGLVFGHSSARLRHVVHGFASGYISGAALLAEYLVQEGSAFGAAHIPAAKSHQELSDLRLEDHDECDESHIQYGLHNVGHQPHIEGGDNNPDHIQRNDGNEDAHRRCPPDPSEDDEYDEGEQKYVQDVSKRQLQESENCQ